MKVKVSVTGGKGGTGKSTIAVNLAVSLSKHRKIVLADLDVEAPNDYILLNTKLENEEPVKIMLPFIEYPKCIKCGTCAQVCDTGAIMITRGKLPFIIPRLCSGCRACFFACPVKAVVEGQRIIGYTYHSKAKTLTTTIDLVTGVLREGEEHVPPVVLATRNRAMSLAEDVLLVDTSAGTANHVAIALEDSKLAIAVTEPTPLGLHDLEMILELTNILGIETWVIVNRWDIGRVEKVEELARKWGTRIIARIPYSREIVESCVKSIPLVELYPTHPISKTFYNLAKTLSEVL